MTSAVELRSIVEVLASDGLAECRFDDGSRSAVPLILAQLLRRNDQLRFLGSNTELLIQRPAGRRCQQLLHATIGYVGLPQPGKNGEAFVRAELSACNDGPKALFLSAEALRRYFYLLEGDAPQCLYRVLQVPDTATLDQLRFAWRMRSLELQVSESKARDLACVERAFNVLAHADLRRCYDSLCKDGDAEPLFPYGGFGSILVEGHLSDDDSEFFADRIVCRDPRRKLEVWLDSNILPGLNWDLTWNHWKHWLRTRIEVEATFVHAGKYRLYNGEWILRKWQAALPSRLRVHVPSSVAEDVQHAHGLAPYFETGG